MDRVQYVLNSAISFFLREDKLQSWERKMRSVNTKSAQKLTTYLPADGVFIDVGANVGAFTDNILKVRENCQCYLFEPVSEYYSYCVKKYNGNKRIIIENYALGDNCGESTIYTDEKNLGWNTIIEPMITPGMTMNQIKMIKFDDYADEKGLDKIDLLKIDVEGAEYKVLNGMKKTLSGLDMKPVIFCEIGWGSKMHPYWQNECEIFEWLFKNGYRRFDYDTIGATRDILILPE